MLVALGTDGDRLVGMTTEFEDRREPYVDLDTATVG